MNICFYDSSSFVKLFVREMGTEAMIRLHKSAESVFVSRLAFVEATSAMTRIEREGYFSSKERARAQDSLEKEAGQLNIVELDAGIVAVAQSLLVRHVLRSLDAIQLASALAVQNSSPVVFVSSDARLLSAAGLEGFRIMNPVSMTGA